MSEELPIEIDVTTTRDLLASDPRVALIDVRGQNEYATASIAGSRLFPMNEIQEKLDEIKAIDADRIIVHCHHGGRSMQVTQWLRGNGVPHAQNMAGGIDVWSQEIDTDVPRY